MRMSMAAAAAVAVVTLSACGTSLPNRDFSALESSSQSTTGAGSSQTNGATGTSGGSTGTGAASATGPAGVTSTSGGSNPSGSSGNAGGTTAATGKKATGPAAPAGSCGGGTNTASDAGVTPTAVKIGVIYSGTGNPFAPDQFIVSYYGMRAYVGWLDQHGGVCGRSIEIDPCDDNGDRNVDISCAHRLIDQDKVFALVGNDVYQYAAAPYVSQSKVPDIGGQPVTGSAYYTYPYLYSILGSLYANNGQQPSAYWGPTGLGKFFKAKLHLTRAGVIHYAQPDSQRGANYIEGWLKANGVKYDDESLPLAGDATPEVTDMRNNHDQAVFNSLDINGNQNLCRAMQQNGFNVPVIGTISIWTQQVGSSLNGYQCLNNFWSWGTSTNYADSGAGAKQFRAAYNQFSPGAPMSEWSLQGYVAAMWFADAAASCGAKLTRTCVESYVDSKKGYGGHGLIDPNSTAFPHYSSQPSKITQCYTIVKWGGGTHGTWSTVADHSHTCYTTPVFSYSTS